MMLLILLAVFTAAGGVQTPGALLDSTFGEIQKQIESLKSSQRDSRIKYEELEKEINALKPIKTKCAPCLDIPDTDLYCDCRHLGAKQDCVEFRDAGVLIDGVYTLEGEHFRPLYAYCDQTTYGGGWTVIQRRTDGSVDFNLDWNAYRNGFGKLSGEFWYGNDNIHTLTKSSRNPNSSQLLINMKMRNETNQVWAKYDTFSVGDNTEKFVLDVGKFSGNASDSMAYHDGMKFTTVDEDNDIWNMNCAQYYKGGWWYKTCYLAHLNGIYEFTEAAGEVRWKSMDRQPEFSEMKVRRNKP